MESIIEKEEDSSEDDRSAQSSPSLAPEATGLRSLRSSNVSRRQQPSDTTPPKRQANWEEGTTNPRAGSSRFRSTGQWPVGGLTPETAERNAEFPRAMPSLHRSVQQHMAQGLRGTSSPAAPNKRTPELQSTFTESTDTPTSGTDSDESPAISPTASPSTNLTPPLRIEGPPESPDLSDDDDDDPIALSDLISLGQTFTHQGRNSVRPLPRSLQHSPRSEKIRNESPLTTVSPDKVCRYKRLENLYWWETIIRINLLIRRSVGKSMDSGLRALRAAEWIPRETFYVGETIGRGTFGTAFKVETKKGKKYVLKKMAIPTGLSRSQFRLFNQLRIERDSLLINHHPNIIRIKASWVVPAGPDVLSFFLMMELAQYGTVAKFIKKARSECSQISKLLDDECMYFNEYDEIEDKYLTRLQDLLKASKLEIVKKERSNPYEANCFRSLVLRWSREFVSAVDYIHSQGISHRDLKTDNVLIGSGFHIKIADFGISNINHPIYSNKYYQILDDTEYENETDFFQFPSVRTPNDFEMDLDFTMKFLLALSTGVEVGMSGAIMLLERDRRTKGKAIAERFVQYLFFDNFLLDVYDTIEQLSHAGLTGNVVDRKLLINSSLFALSEYQNLRTLNVDLYIAELYEQELRSEKKNVTRTDIFKTENWRVTPNLELLNVYLDDSVLRTPL